MMFCYNAQHIGDFRQVARSIVPNGAEKWQFTSGVYMSSPALANGGVYIGSYDTTSMHSTPRVTSSAGLVSDIFVTASGEWGHYTSRRTQTYMVIYGFVRLGLL